MAYSFVKPISTLLLATSACLMAQDFEESSRVLLREVRMHIVDKDGNHVPNLKPDDFTIEEDGQFYKLSFFEEVDRSVPISEEPVTDYKEIEGVQRFSDSHQKGPRKLTLVIDTSNFSHHYYKEMKKELETFIFEKVDPATLVQIIQIDGDMNPLTGYTPDRNQLREALDKMEYHGKLIKQIQMLESSILNNISASIGLIASNNLLGPMSSDPATPEAAKESRKGPGYWFSADVDIRQKAYFKSLHYKKFTVQMLRIAHALRGGSGSQAVLLVTGGQFVEEYGLYPRTLTVADTLAQAFNGVGIPLFVHLPKPKAALMENSGAIQGNLTRPGSRGFQWDFDTLSQASTFNPARDDRQRIGPYRTTVMENLQHMEGAPRYAAEWTGGQLTIDNNTSSIDERLLQLFEASGKYYRLGYTRFVDDVPKVVNTMISVAGAKENDWQVRYGKESLPTYGLDERPDQQNLVDIPENPTISVSQTLHQGEPGANDLNVSEGFYVFPGIQKGVRIPVYMRLPQPETPSERGYELGFAALGKGGLLLDHTVFAIDYGHDNEPLLFYDMLMTEEEPEEIRYFIREIGGETQSFRSVPFLREPSNISTLLLTDGSNNDFVVSPHHVRKEDQERASADPLSLGESIFPFKPGDYVFDSPESVRFFFTLNDTEVSSQMSFETWLELEDGTEVVPTHKVQMLPVKEKQMLRFQGAITTTELPPGNYALYVRIADGETNAEYMQNQMFQISKDRTN